MLSNHVFKTIEQHFCSKLRKDREKLNHLGLRYTESGCELGALRVTEVVGSLEALHELLDLEAVVNRARFTRLLLAVAGRMIFQLFFLLLLLLLLFT